MPKAKAKKPQEFETSMTKCAFFHGTPNKAKAKLFADVQKLYTDEANRLIQEINSRPECLSFLVRADNRSSEMRQLEKELRSKNLSATFGQAAFDEAFTKLSNRMDNIRKDVIAVIPCPLTISKMLYGVVLAGGGRKDLVDTIEAAKLGYKNVPERFDEWKGWIDKQSDSALDLLLEDIRTWHALTEGLYKVPEIKKAHVRLVSTNFWMETDQASERFKLEEAQHIKADAVFGISLPGEKGYTVVPLKTSSRSMSRLKRYGACHSAEYTMTDDGDLVVTVAFNKKIARPKVSSYNGVDTGILDALHSRKDGAIGTMRNCIDYYKDVVEPLFGQISTLRNHKRALKRYLRKHRDRLPATAVKAIRDKMDRLEKMIRTARKAHAANRNYHNLLKKAVRNAVTAYIASLHGDKTIVTVLELLDIKEFNKSRKVNGMMSTFARGLLTSTLMKQLNWNGYSYAQVDPAFTSQACPVCSYTNSANRNGKDFTCGCCGFKDDADHVGSINIEARAQDTEISAACEKYLYNKKDRHKAILDILTRRNAVWTETNNKKTACA